MAVKDVTFYYRVTPPRAMLCRCARSAPTQPWRKHGTMLRGSAVGNARLTEADVRAMRRAWPATSLAALAHRYGVSKSTAACAVNGRTWSHVA